MKQCSICKQEKDLSNFHLNKTNSDGLDKRCKLCRKEKARDQYEKDPIKTLLKCKKSECIKKDISFNLDYNYLKSIWTGICPIFNTEITLGNKGCGSHRSAHLDRIDPNKGYIQGNVAYISGRANRIKYNASFHELRKIADWIENQLESATTIREE